MKLARVLLLAAGLAGCAKASDLSAQQQETVSYAHSYDPRLYDIYQRANDYLPRINELADKQSVPGAQDAHNALARMNAVYKGMKHIVDTVPNQVDAAIKAGKPDALRTIAMGLGVNPGAPGSQPAPPTDMHIELQRVMDSLHARLTDGYVEANGHLDAVEAWLLRAENAHHEEPPLEVSHPPPTPPKEGNEQPPDEGAGSGSGAPPAGAGSAPRPAAGSAQPAQGSATPR